MNFADKIRPSHASSAVIKKDPSGFTSEGLNIYPSELYFGAMVVGEDELTREFVVTNVSTKSIRVDQVILEQDGEAQFVLDGTHPGILKSGESFTMSASYAGSELGFKVGTIRIDSSDDGSPYNLGLSARVISSLYLEAMYDEFKASLLEEAWVRAEADFAEAGHRLLLQAQMGEDISAMAEILTTAYVDADTAVVTHMETYIAEKNYQDDDDVAATITASFTEFIQVTVDGDNALGQKIDNLAVSISNLTDDLGDYVLEADLESYIKNVEYVYVGDGVSKSGTTEELFSDIDSTLTTKLGDYTKTTNLTAYIKNVQYTYTDVNGVSQSGTSQQVFSGIQMTVDNKLANYTATSALTAYIKNVQYTYTDVNGVSQAGTNQQVLSGIQTTVDNKLAGYTTTNNLTAYINNVQYTYTDIMGVARTETRTQQVSRLQSDVSSQLSGKLNSTDLTASVKNITFTFTDATTGLARADQIEDLFAQVSQTVKDTKDDIPTTTEITAQINSHAYSYTDLNGIGRAESLTSYIARYNGLINGAASSAASSAVTTYNQALVDGTNAFGSRVNTIEVKVDGKPIVIRQASIPSGTGRIQGDQWYDTDDGNKPYVWITGSGWVDNSDGRFFDLTGAPGSWKATVTDTFSAQATLNTATANKLTKLGALSGDGSAWILDEDTVYIDATTSLASKLLELEAIGDAGVAGGLLKFEAEVGSGEVASRIRLWTRAETTDAFEEAGMLIESVIPGVGSPYSRIKFTADIIEADNLKAGSVTHTALANDGFMQFYSTSVGSSTFGNVMQISSVVPEANARIEISGCVELHNGSGFTEFVKVSIRLKDNGGTVINSWEPVITVFSSTGSNIVPFSLDHTLTGGNAYSVELVVSHDSGSGSSSIAFGKMTAKTYYNVS